MPKSADEKFKMAILLKLGDEEVNGQVKGRDGALFNRDGDRDEGDEGDKRGEGERNVLYVGAEVG